MSDTGNITGECWTRERLYEVAKQYDVPKYKWNQLDSTIYKSYRKAAVLIPLFIQDGSLRIWLTRRSDKVGSDKGDTAFPGGMRDEGEDEVATCLREACEEIGLKSSQVEILCTLLPRINRRGICITPLIGIVDPHFKPVPNDEVALVFNLPFDRFLSASSQSSSNFTNRGLTMKILFFHDDIDGELITTWGLTASLCVEVAVAILQRPTEYEYSTFGVLTPDDPFKLHTMYLEIMEKQPFSSKY